MKNPTPVQTSLVQAVEQVIPQKCRKLQKISPPPSQTAQTSSDTAETRFKEKIIPLLHKKMESYHFTIAQLTYNMGKLGGKTIPINDIVKKQCQCLFS